MDDNVQLKNAKWKRWGLAAGQVFIVSVFYFAFVPVNRTEAEDAYEYAWRLSHESGIALLDAHHLIFLPFAKLVSIVVTPVLPLKDSLSLLSLISSVSTAFMLLLLFRLLRDRIGFASKDAFLVAGITGVSYGVWRYAGESEIYALSSLFAIWLLYVSLNQEGKVGKPMAAAILAVAGTCVHVMNILPAFAIGVVCLCQRRWKVAFIYGATFVAGLLAVLACVMALGWDPFSSHETSTFAYEGNLLSPKSHLRSLVGIGTGILSSQFVFSFGIMEHFAGKWFPGMSITEELFFGKILGARLGITGVVLLSFCGISALWLGLVSIKNWRWSRNRTSAAALAQISGLWFLVYSIIVFRFDPAAPEFWVQALPALFLFVFSLLALGGGLPAGRRALGFLMLFMLLHNGFVGILPLKNGDADYNAVKAKPLLEQVREDDLVISSDTWIAYQYLRYYSPCDVIFLYTVASADEIRDRMTRVNGSVYALEDLGNPPKSMKLRYPDKWSIAKEVGLELRREASVTIISENSPEKQGQVY